MEEIFPLKHADFRYKSRLLLCFSVQVNVTTVCRAFQINKQSTVVFQRHLELYSHDIHPSVELVT